MIKYTEELQFRELDTLGSFNDIVCKGNNFCDFLIALLHIFLCEQIFPFTADAFSDFRDSFDRVATLESVFLPFQIP